jgi:hypothetical protein
LTSEYVTLGEADAEARWIGVRRHQAALVIVGVGLAGDWVISPRAPVIEAALGVAILLCALPANDGLTVGEQCVAVARFVLRSHWRELNVRELGGDVVLWARGDVSFRAYELVHRGRLDLSGRDEALAEALAALADAASAAKVSQHLSVHVTSTRDGATTLLILPVNVPAPDGWRLNNERALALLDPTHSTLRLLERFTYTRTRHELVRLYRVRDFSSVPNGRGLLEQLLRVPTPHDVTLHVEVVSGPRAHRVAARAVHRVGSDDEAARAAGFRRTARSSRNFARLSQREALVASGRSLLRVAVFVSVRGQSLEELRRDGVELWRSAHDGGLRLERGRGRQTDWFVAQLPGGPNW